ncbi:MAG: thiol reductant ABC exporter subunit CydD [Chloroflexi bacterium]|nr:thiol reductant ABC exporter subunit CydD [Chloroflexota bacterium]
MSSNSAMNISKNLLDQIRESFFPFTITLLTGWLNGVLIVLQAWLLSSVIAGVFLNHQTLEDEKSPLAWLLGVIILRAILRYFQHTSAQRMAVSINGRLRIRLMEKIFDLGPVYTQETHSGELTTLAMQGLETLETYYGQYIPQLVLAAAIPITILVAVFPIDLLSAVILLVTAPLIPFFMILIGKTAEKLTQRQWKTLKRLGAYFMDTVQGLTTLKILNRTREQGENITRVSEQYRVATLNVLKVTFLSALALEMLATLSTAIIAVQIGLRLLEGRMLFQQALFILVIAPDFYQPLRNLGLRFHAGISGVTIARQLFDILDKPDWRSNPVENCVPVEKLVAAPLEFRNVCFIYPDRPEAALRNISFTLQPGTVTALAGRSGAGKSTLFNLLLRFIEPDQGVITLDGQSIQMVNPEDWRKWIAWVPQSPFLLNSTITANIAMGVKPDMERVRRAARLARLDEFIESLPDKYETHTGERGVRLSGGQAQRLALARAFYRDAPLLLLDEPSTYIDAQNADAIQKSIRELSKGRTTLIIAHHSQMLAWADQVLVLEEGRILTRTGQPVDMQGEQYNPTLTNLSSGDTPFWRKPDPQTDGDIA